MAKQVWKGGNMLYPLPAVMVSCANAAGEKDIVTVAWAGTVCTNPPMLSISLRPERHSYHVRLVRRALGPRLRQVGRVPPHGRAGGEARTCAGDR